MMPRLWDWAVEAYGREGVADMCLTLQDAHSQNVPLLLWAAWRGATGQGVESNVAVQAAGLARAWSDTAIVPLRDLRRRLKTEISEGDETQRLKLRDLVKAAELEAEKALLDQLESLLVPTGGTRGSTIMDTLTVVSAAWSDEVPHSVLTKLSEALTKGQILGYNGGCDTV